MPVKLRPRISPNKKSWQVSGQSGALAVVLVKKIQTFEPKLRPKEKMDLVSTVQEDEEEELEIPTSSYFRVITKSLVKLLEISTATIVALVVAYTAKYFEVDTIFENAEKVEVILDDEAKKEERITHK